MDRDLLSKIPGDVLARALHSLPDAMVTVEDTLYRVVELPDGVRAKVTFARLMANRYSRKHNRSRWFWAAASAVIVTEQAKAVTDDNILSKIPGELLTPTRNGLPQAHPDCSDTQRVIIRLPDGARAEVTFVKLKSKEARRRAGSGRRTAQSSLTRDNGEPERHE